MKSAIDLQVNDRQKSWFSGPPSAGRGLPGNRPVPPCRPSTPRRGLKIHVFALFAVGLLLFPACSLLPVDFSTLELERGEFLVSHFETGELMASSSEVVTSPRMRGSLKIIHLWPEGEQVDIGDLLIEFESAEFEREMLDREGGLEQAIAQYEKAKAEMAQRLLDLSRNIERQQAQYELAELAFQRAQLSSTIDQERAGIELEKAERAVAQARENYTAQQVVNRVDLNRHERNITRRRERYEEARRDYERTRIYAAEPGIVVYRKMRQRGGAEETKVAVGDQVWGGRALMDIPDLSQMQVICQIGEVDIKHMALGQKAFIRLDAFPGPVFHGAVTNLAPMATAQSGAPDIQVFELYIDIEEQDIRLKPGMSAEVEIVLETIPAALSVPLNAIFTHNDQQVVYRRRGTSFEPVFLTLGPRNATAAVIESGLEEGDIIALKDPTQR